MGYFLPADEAGFQKLEVLRSWSLGRPSPIGDPPGVVAIFLFEPGVHLELEEWLRWNFDLLDQESGRDLHFFVPASPAGARRQVGTPEDQGEARRRSEMNHWLGIASDQAERVRVVMEGGWTRLVADLFGVPTSRLPGAVVFCPAGRGRAGDIPRSTYVPLADQAAASSFIDSLLSKARRLRRGATDATSLHGGLLGWRLDHSPNQEEWPAVSRGADEAPWPGGRPPTDRHLELQAAAGLLSQHCGLPTLGDDARAKQIFDAWAAVSDPETRAVVRSAEVQFALYASGGDASDVDWSGVGCALAKAFERTVSLSLLHEARHGHHIDLPRFFERYMPGLERSRGSEGKLDLNAPLTTWHSPELSQDVPWKSLSLMESRLAYEACLRNGHVAGNGLSTAASSRFTALWDDLARLRNPVAHNLVVGRSHAELVIDRMEELLQLDIPARLARIRRRYAPVESEEAGQHPYEDRLVGCHVTAIGIPRPDGVLQLDLEAPVRWSFRRGASPALQVSLLLGGDRRLDFEPLPLGRHGLRPGDYPRLSYTVLGLERLRPLAEWLAARRAYDDHEAGRLHALQAERLELEKLGQQQLLALSEALTRGIHTPETWEAERGRWPVLLEALVPNLRRGTPQSLAEAAKWLGIPFHHPELDWDRANTQVGTSFEKAIPKSAGRVRGELRRLVRAMQAGESPPRACMPALLPLLQQVRDAFANQPAVLDRIGDFEHTVESLVEAFEALSAHRALNRAAEPTLLELWFGVREACKLSHRDLHHELGRATRVTGPQATGTRRAVEESRRQSLFERMERHRQELTEVLRSRLAAGA